MSYATVVKYVPPTLFQRARTSVKNYFIRLGLDYRDVGVEMAQKVAARPFPRALAPVGLLWIGYAFHSNPDEESWNSELMRARERLSMLGYGERNAESQAWVSTASALHFKGRTRHLDLGLFSLILKEEEGRSVARYSAHAPLLKPRWRDFPSRVLDIGGLGVWYYLSSAMKDYDIDHGAHAYPATL